MGIKEKKKSQLGMDAGTAANRLKIDLLFDFVVKAGHKCFRCGKDLTRDTFSVEHKVEWLDSEDPVGKFFDIGNIAYSHQKCNYGAKRIPHKKFFNKEDRRKATLEISRQSKKRNYTTEKRREKYRRNGT